MSEYILREHSPRHGFPFNHLPTFRNVIWGGSSVYHHREPYGLILDCTYEMAEDVSGGNGITPEEAVDQVCKDENWRVMPRHRKMIVAKLKETA